MKTRIHTIQFSVNGRNYKALMQDINDIGLETKSKMHAFGIGGAEYFELFLEMKTEIIAAFAYLLATYIKNGKRLKIKYKDGQIESITAEGYGLDKAVKAVEKIESIHVRDN